VPISMHDSVEFALRMFDGVFDAARRITTATGNVLNWPTAIETNTGTKLAEAGTVNQANPTFGIVQRAGTVAQRRSVLIKLSLRCSFWKIRLRRIPQRCWRRCSRSELR
jgi:hypothetical protein